MATVKDINSSKPIVKLSSFGTGEQSDISNIRYIGRGAYIVSDETGNIILKDNFHDAVVRRFLDVKNHNKSSFRIIVSLPDVDTELAFQELQAELVMTYGSHNYVIALHPVGIEGATHSHAHILLFNSPHNPFHKKNEVFRLRDTLGSRFYNQGLSFQQPEEINPSKSLAEINIIKRGEDSWKENIRIAVSEALKETLNYDEFISILESKGIKISRETASSLTLTDGGVFANGKPHAVRISKLFSGIKSKNDVIAILNKKAKKENTKMKTTKEIAKGLSGKMSLGELEALANDNNRIKEIAREQETNWYELKQSLFQIIKDEKRQILEQQNKKDVIKGHSKNIISSGLSGTASVISSAVSENPVAVASALGQGAIRMGIEIMQLLMIYRQQSGESKSPADTASRIKQACNQLYGKDGDKVFSALKDNHQVISMLATADMCKPYDLKDEMNKISSPAPTSIGEMISGALEVADKTIYDSTDKGIDAIDGLNNSNERRHSNAEINEEGRKKNMSKVAPAPEPKPKILSAEEQGAKIHNRLNSIWHETLIACHINPVAGSSKYEIDEKGINLRYACQLFLIKSEKKDYIAKIADKYGIDEDEFKRAFHDKAYRLLKTCNSGELMKDLLWVAPKQAVKKEAPAQAQDYNQNYSPGIKIGR